MPYVLDTNGSNEDNVVLDELHTIPALTVGTNHRVIIPNNSPYYLTGGLTPMTVYIAAGSTRTPLTRGVDWVPLFQFQQATRTTEFAIYGALSIINPDLSVGTVALDYHTVGDNWILEPSAINAILAELSGNFNRQYWESVAGYPEQFPVVLHPHEEEDIVGLSDIATKLDEVAAAIVARPAGVDSTELASHITNVQAQISIFLDALSSLRDDLEDQIAAGVGGIDLSDIEDAIEALETTVSGLVINVGSNNSSISTLVTDSDHNRIAINKLGSYEFTPTAAANFTLSPSRLSGKNIYVQGDCTGVVLDDIGVAGEWGVGEWITITHGGSEASIDVVFADNTATPLFTSYNKNTNAFVQDSVLTIDAKHVKVTILKISPIAFMVIVE